MNLLGRIVLALAAFAQAASTPVSTPTPAPTTWYIRADGGNRAHCTGTTDAAYVAGGTLPEACGFNDYRLLAFPGPGGYVIVGTWLVKGGDTIRIHAGQYRVGYNGPNAADHDGLAIAGNPFTSALPPIPSGTATNPTKIIGDGSATTQLYGGYGAGNVISLSGSSFVQISGLELTDHGQCTRVGGGYTAPVVGCSSSVPIADYAGTGIGTDVGTHDITLTDLNIHGFTSDGIRGAVGGLITVDHVRIAFNGDAGWDFDNGSGTQSVNNSTITASYLTIEGNGCNEEYPIVHTGFPAFSCFDQSSAGYGDGVGTPATPLNLTCDHCTFAYNTQDGLDLLHTSGSVVKVTNSTSYGNMGQQWKLGPMAQVDFEYNTWVHNCKRMAFPIAGNSTYDKYLSNFCRAAGDGFAMAISDASQITIANNSYAGYGNTTYDISCGGTCTKPVITFQNNLHIGYTAPASIGGQKPAVFYYSMTYTTPFVANDHNIDYNMRTLPAGGVGTDPMIANEPTDKQVTTDETVLDNIDFDLTAGSTSAYGSGVGGLNIGALGMPIVTSTPPGAASGFTLVCQPNGSSFTCSMR
jgi:hypothetical protein